MDLSIFKWMMMRCLMMMWDDEVFECAHVRNVIKILIITPHLGRCTHFDDVILNILINQYVDCSFTEVALNPTLHQIHTHT